MHSVRIWILAGALLLGAGTALAQDSEERAPAEAPEQATETAAGPVDEAESAQPTGEAPPETEAQPEAEAPVEEIQQMPVPNLSRSSWIVLMAILGEQLPDEVLLEEVAFLDTESDAIIRLILPRANGAALQSELMQNLQRYFTTVQADAFTGPGTALYLQGVVRLSGVPTLAVYRQRKSAADAAAQVAIPPRPAPAPRPDPWPSTEVRQVFTHGPNEGMVAQLLLNGSEYIVREGRAFASNQYRFVGVAPPSAEAPNQQCIILERLATGDTRTFCIEAVP